MTKLKDPVDLEESRNAPVFDSLPSVRTDSERTSITAIDTDTDTNPGTDTNPDPNPDPAPVPVGTSRKPIDVTKYMSKNPNILRGREVFRGGP